MKRKKIHKMRYEAMNNDSMSERNAASYPTKGPDAYSHCARPVDPKSNAALTI